MWSISPIILDLKYTWKISRNASDQKTNLIVTYSDGKYSGRGEAAPNVRYNESAEEGLRQFELVANDLDKVKDAVELRQLLKEKNIFNSLQFAIESAWFHFHSATTGKSIPELLGIPAPGMTGISFTIPIMDTGLLKQFYKDNHLSRFPYIKLKVNHEDAFESLHHLQSFCSQPIMVDANESFTDVEKCIYWMEKIKRIPLVLLEQPMPAKMVTESEYLKKYSPFVLFADESMTDHAEFPVLKKSFDGVNMKLMKAGGYINGLNLLKEAKRHNMKTMIGCMVETTLAISSALHLCSLADYADLDSFLLLTEEPFRMVRETEGNLELAD
jgi:L-alanine-DL-glutamate epimerase-like enolase superfamily enzyme